MQANRSVDVIFIMIFVPDEPIANAMLERGR